ncbi:MAG TPA: lysophospholipid acyltransferase family protein [Pyrinomonadaceae bacterium]|jgi:1-acyl-sn-glycerol-3-phosphate acyltransferase
MTSDGGEKAKRSKEFNYPSSLVTGALRAFGFSVSKLCWFLRYRGLENIPKDNASFVLVSNHPTYLDPVWVSIPVHRDLRFMAWDHVFDWPLVGKLIRYLGAFPVKTDRTVSKGAIVESLRTLRTGGGLVIFPEGEREFADGEFLEFKPGALHIAMNAGVPVLPVSVSGGSRVWPQGQKFPSIFRRVVVTYHPVLSLPACPPGVELDEHLEKLNRDLIKTIRSAV